MPRPDPKTALERVDLDALNQRVVKYATRHFKQLDIATGGEWSPEDLVQEAFVLVWRGTRSWPTYWAADRASILEDDLFILLCGTVRSIAGHKRADLGDDLIHDTFGESAPDVWRPSSAIRSPSGNDQEFGRLLQDILDNELRAQLQTVLGDDKIALKIALTWAQDPFVTPRALASELGNDIEEIRNAVKRLRRRAADLNAILKEGYTAPAA